jgi:hypothetical protein
VSKRSNAIRLFFQDSLVLSGCPASVTEFSVNSCSLEPNIEVLVINFNDTAVTVNNIRECTFSINTGATENKPGYLEPHFSVFGSGVSTIPQGSQSFVFLALGQENFRKK